MLKQYSSKRFKHYEKLKKYGGANIKVSLEEE
jgi:hypothetical protein